MRKYIELSLKDLYNLDMVKPDEGASCLVNVYGNLFHCIWEQGYFRQAGTEDLISASLISGWIGMPQMKEGEW
jgi:hypothetical protein